MDNELGKLNSNLEQMIAVLEKTQDELADKVDALLEKLGEVTHDIATLRAEVKRIHTAKPNNAVDLSIDDDDDSGDDNSNVFDELANFDADDDLSDDDMERLGYNVK